MSTSIIDLPEELLYGILSHLSFGDLLRCCSACRHLKDVVEKRVELQYIIELGADGVVDITAKKHVTIAERLERLRSLRASWALLDCSRRSVLSFPGSASCYGLIGGLYMSLADNNPGPSTLSCVPLPRLGAPEETATAVDVGAGAVVENFIWDPFQDLAVFMEKRETPEANREYSVAAQLRSMSTGGPHPEAARSVLVAAVGKSAPANPNRIQVLDNILAVMFSATFVAFKIWDWKTSAILLELDDMSFSVTASDFCLLAPNAFVVTSVKNPGYINLYTFDATAGLAKCSHVASLMLPELKYTDRLDSILNRLRMEVTPVLSGLGAQSGRSPSFAASFSDRLFVFLAEYEVYEGEDVNDLDGEETRLQYRIAVLHRTLMSYIPTKRFGAEHPKLRTVPWSEWGPHQSRFLESEEVYLWSSQVHGLRTVFPVSSPDDAPVLEIHDYNVNPMTSFTASEPNVSSGIRSSDVWERTLVQEPSMIRGGFAFKDHVKTFLPYWRTRRSGLACDKRGKGVTGFMIDEDHIVALFSEPFKETDVGEVHVYAL